MGMFDWLKRKDELDGYVSPSIGEPILKLLNMLDDESQWIAKSPDGIYSLYSFDKEKYKLVHKTRKETLEAYELKELYSTHDNDLLKLEGFEWANTKERNALAKKIQKVWKSLDKAQNLLKDSQQREEYKKKLEQPATTSTVVQPDISEPVIKLLAMLDEDVWEPSNVHKDWDLPFSYYTMSLRHVYNESFIINYKLTETVGCYSDSTNEVVEGCQWMTPYESKIVASKVSKRSGEIAKLNIESRYPYQRLKYKELLESL